ncbi:MAG: AsmA family protein [Aeromonadaceae bacterium]|nr:AsmA family protein [Aeromonadaceae bacterium]
MKPFLYLLLCLLLLIGGGLVTTVWLINPEQFKPLIIEQVKASTGRDLLMQGPIRFTLFPRLGLFLEDVALQNPAGFPAGNTLAFAEASVDLALLPLLEHKVAAGRLKVSGARLSFITLADGRTNLDGLLGATEPAAVPEKGAQPTTEGDSAYPFSLAGIDFTDGALSIDDHLTGKQWRLKDVTLQADALALGRPIPVSVGGEVQAKQGTVRLESQATLTLSPDLILLDKWQAKVAVTGDGISPLLQQMSLAGQLRYQPADKLLAWDSLELTAGPWHCQGELSLRQQAIPVVRFALRSPAFDTAWLAGKGDAEVTSSAQGKAATEVPAQEPDLSGLQGLDLAGTLRLDSLQLGKLPFKQVELALNLQNGLLDWQQRSASLFEGKVSAPGRLDSRQTPARLSLQPKVQGIAITKLSQALLGRAPLSGQGQLEGRLTAEGLTPAGLRRSLSGNLAVQVTQGAVRGVDLAALLRQAKAGVKGLLGGSQDQGETAFSSLGAQALLTRGDVKVENIKMVSPLLQVAGAGRTHLVKQSLDFKLDATVIGDLPGLGDLKMVTVPLRITGRWEQPKYSVELGRLLESRAKALLEQSVLPAGSRPKLGNPLKGLLGN